MNRPTFPRRAHRGGAVMTAAQFWAIAQVLRIQMPNREAARRVLVDGITQIRAGAEFGLSRQSVGNSVGRIQRAHDLMLAVYVDPFLDPEPPPPSQKGATVSLNWRRPTEGPP